MALSFLYRLMGITHFRGVRIDNLPEEFQEVLSVLFYLRELLNTRRGSFLGDSAYGIPDFPIVHGRIPTDVDKYGISIKRCIVNYDRRVDNVRLAE
ncbi:MAG: hypothetical protein GF344_07620 [Chitinivibrionales bacterium]|nr:hypothetical protein [Chitinivibrionales bacterium]MBD3356767.1 hypothetical protein [Chitinivibrionales bacterium]